MSNNEILQQYEDFVCGRYSSKATRETFCIHPKVLLRWLDMPANDITQHDLDKYLRYCLDTKKPNGNYIRFRCVKVFLEWLGKEVTVPYVKKVDAGKQALDDSELDKIFSTIESLTPLHRLVFYLEYDTIRRPSEIRNIKLNDRYGNTLKYSGKSGNVIGVKTCRMTQRLLDAWDDYVRYTRPLPITPEDGEYLLLSEVNTRRGKRLLSNMMVTRVIKEVALHSKIEPPNGENPGNYLIKRTSITRQLKECPDPKIIQMQAGHQDLNTTMRYNRVRNEDIDKYLTKLEQNTKKDKDSPESLNKSSLSRKRGRRQQSYVINLPQEPQTESLNKNEIEETVDVSNWSCSFSFSFDTAFSQSNCFYRSNSILRLHTTNNRDNLCCGQSSEYAFCWTVAFSPIIDFCEPIVGVVLLSFDIAELLGDRFKKSVEIEILEARDKQRVSPPYISTSVFSELGGGEIA